MDSGTRLGIYEIVEPLGAGGMGEVYRARDTKLEREVAIKVLPAMVAADPERLARLEREARVLASLEHPNVAAVYGLDEQNGVTFLVMQLAAGETLADRIAAGPLPVDEALEVARQIAEGLEAAHESGVVHRDLKPGNVMVAPGGDVKILDFGLAKAMAADEGAGGRDADLSASPTMMAMSSAGMILGTAAYMSPEQARGRPLDRRTDIWAFGCVLYEMLTGASAFGGDTVTDVLAAVVTRDPDWAALPAGLPPAIEHLLRRCLVKDARQRLRDIGEFRIALANPDAAAAPGPREPERAATGGVLGGRLGWLAAATLALVTLLLGWQAWAGRDAHQEPAYVALFEPGIRLLADFEGVQVAVSPEGDAVAIAGADDRGAGLWVRRLDEPDAQRLEDVAGYSPTWSPDGQRLAFLGPGPSLRVHDLRTGATAVRYESTHRLTDPTWSAEGRLVFGEQVGRDLRILESRTSGEVVELVGRSETSSGGGVRARMLNSDKFLVSRWESSHGHVDTTIVNEDGSSGEALLHLGAAVEWAPPDLLLFARDGALWAQRFDVDAGRLRGEPVALLAEIDTAPGVTPWLSVGGDTLAYRTGLGSETPTVLEWVDREGDTLERVREPANIYDPRLGPDDATIVYDLSNEGDAGNIWAIDASGLSSRLTSSPADETRPVFSPDGGRVVIETTRAGQPGRLFVKDVDDPAGELRSLGADPAVEEATDWAGDTIVANDSSQSTIWVVDASTGDSRPFRETGFNDYGATLAPGGTHVAYVSDETGRDEIWVESFPEPGARRRISQAGGTNPVWRRDGREILFLDPEGYINSVAVTDGDPLSFGAPERLFQITLRRHEIRQFDVTSDGSRILVNRVMDNPDLPIRLLLGWRAELARRAGTSW